VDAIARASGGLTRRVNIIADKSLLAAYSEGTHTLTPDHVRNAIADAEFTRRNGPVSGKVATRMPRWAPMAAALCAMVAAVGWFLLRR
jgi:hypothetical protein